MEKRDQRVVNYLVSQWGWVIPIRLVVLVFRHGQEKGDHRTGHQGPTARVCHADVSGMGQNGWFYNIGQEGCSEQSQRQTWRPTQEEAGDAQEGNVKMNNVLMRKVYAARAG
jgi:hypothetical protein